MERRERGTDGERVGTGGVGKTAGRITKFDFPPGDGGARTGPVAETGDGWGTGEPVAGRVETGGDGQRREKTGKNLGVGVFFYKVPYGQKIFQYIFRKNLRGGGVFRQGTIQAKKKTVGKILRFLYNMEFIFAHLVIVLFSPFFFPFSKFIHTINIVVNQLFIRQFACIYIISAAPEMK